MPIQIFVLQAWYNQLLILFIKYRLILILYEIIYVYLKLNIIHNVFLVQ